MGGVADSQLVRQRDERRAIVDAVAVASEFRRGVEEVAHPDCDRAEREPNEARLFVALGHEVTLREECLGRE